MMAECRGEVVRNSEAALLEVKPGVVLAVWPEFLKGAGDSDFFPSRLTRAISRDGGRRWENQRTLLSPPPGELNLNSPNLIRRKNGEILLLFLRTFPMAKKEAAHHYPPTSTDVWISRDEGETFQPLQRPGEKAGGPDRNVQLWNQDCYSLCNATVKQLSTGRLITTATRDVPQTNTPGDHWEAGTFYSDDQGLNWHASRSWVQVARRGAMEPHLEELRSGKLLMIMRTQLGSIFQSLSADGGETWSQAASLGVESPESCPDLVQIPGTGNLLLVYNAAKYDPKWASHSGQRTPLSVSVSRDDGKTWSAPRHVETDPHAAFSNPATTFLRDGTALLTYWTCPYTAKGYMANYPIHLKIARLAPAWIAEIK